MTNSKRSLELDFLRFVAVMLVLLRHLAPLPADTPGILLPVLDVAVRLGWMGVDLFFVLSGYLISGLLFREVLQHGRIDFKQFFIRRGLKIYPSFYLFILVTIIAGVVQGWHIPWGKLSAEVFFYQNYLTGLWAHTWSLAVEEHFYLTLPLLLIFLTRRHGGGTPNPFRVLPKFFFFFALVVFAARLLTWWGLLDRPFDVTEVYRTKVFPTHLRIDSLGFGVVLSYYHHFEGPALMEWVRRWRIALAALFVTGVVPSALWELEKTPFLYTAGFTLIYVAMGSLLLLCLVHGLPKNRFFRLGAYLGSFSYPVYLWHLAVVMVLNILIPRYFWVPWWLQMLVYMIGSFITGIIMSKLVEVPVLALRDRYFPSRSKPLQTLPGATRH